MAATDDLARMVPGFDFLQGLMKNAGGGMASVPGMNQWIAPTLDPKELDKRIAELRTVQFWLENNAKLLATTIQALEVQRLTLNTLQTMNLPLAGLGEALKIRPAEPAARPAPAPEATAAPRRAPAAPRAQRKAAAAATGATAAPATPAVDPMQWWGALTQQFTELAAKAMKESAEAAKKLPAAATGAAAAGAAAGAAGAERVPAKPARAPRRR